jgi:hypothetical protein
MSPRWGRKLRGAPSLFAEDNTLAVAYQYEVDFHNQLKARLLHTRILTQVVRESTLFPLEDVPGIDRPKRDKRKQQAAVAWSLTTSTFYKAGGRPWKIDGVRDGVCYVGLVFKRDETSGDPKLACCAAQMFLDSGDGIVFRGAVGPYYSPDKDEFHLRRAEARTLMQRAVQTYETKVGRPPNELFIHGKVGFDDEEWRGFSDAIDSQRTNLVGVKIRDDVQLRLYRLGRHPVLRGTAHIRHDRSALLWTRGLTPRLKSYVGREVPKPLRVEIVRGNADMRVVLSDVLSLTKLNYNTCMLADGLPVTLRFADAIGEILTAGPQSGDSPLPFKYYI